jgi:hypothetical protein
MPINKLWPCKKQKAGAWMPSPFLILYFQYSTLEGALAGKEQTLFCFLNV